MRSRAVRQAARTLRRACRLRGRRPPSACRPFACWPSDASDRWRHQIAASGRCGRPTVRPHTSGPPPAPPWSPLPWPRPAGPGRRPVPAARRRQTGGRACAGPSLFELSTAHRPARRRAESGPSRAPGTDRFDRARGVVVYYWEVFHDVSRPDVHDLLLLSRGPEGPPRRRSSSVLVSRPLIDPHSNRRPEAREAQAFRAFFVPGRR
jgi:hypothetical protein